MGDSHLSLKTNNPLICDVSVSLLAIDSLMSNHRTLEELNKELAVWEERLFLALEVSGVGVWDYDIKEDVLVWDKRMHQLFSTSPETFGKNIKSFENQIHPDYLPLVKERMAESWVKKEIFDYRYRLKNGHTIRGKGKTFYDDQGEPVRMIGVCIECQ